MTACCAACSCKCLLSAQASNRLYVLIIFIFSLLALILRYTKQDMSICINPTGIGGCDATNAAGSWMPSTPFALSICRDEGCRGFFAVYRISFTLAVFFACMLLCTACRTRFAANAHHGHWWTKLVCIAGVLVATLFMPNDAFAGYAWVARFVAPLFMLYQIVVFIDFGYTVNGNLIAKDEAGDSLLCLENEGFKWRGVLLALSALTYVGVITAVALLYSRWPMSCPFNPLAVTTALILGLINTAISISAISEHGALFTSALVHAYSMWLAFSALSSFPVAECNAMLDGASPNPQKQAWLIGSSCVVTALSVSYMAWRMGSRQIGTNVMNGKADDEAAGAAANDQVTVEVAGERREVVLEPDSFGTYHFVMLLVSVYFSMLLTDWGVASVAADQRHNVGYASAWLQLVACWVSSALYTWTLIAPRVCSGRDFG